MKRHRIERRLDDTGRELLRLREELSINDQQLTVMADEADELKLRALVSDDLLAEREHHQVARNVERLRRNSDAILKCIRDLENRQNTLLDRLGGS